MNNSGVYVLVPDDTLWINYDGGLSVGPDSDTNTGEWTLFKSKRQKILEYLRNGRITAAAMGTARDIITGKTIDEPFCMFTDGVYAWRTENVPLCPSGRGLFNVDK